MDASDIINKVLEYSKLSASEFASKIGAKTSQAIYDLQKGRTKTISTAMADKILSCYPMVNRAWLLTGEGKMLKEAAQPIQAPKDTHDEAHRVIYYPNVDGSMGGVFFTDNPDEARQDIIIPGFSDCQYAINAYGDSMSPLIKSGQIVLLSEWHERFIEWGKIYLVITASGYRTIKRLFPGKDEAHITCKSLYALHPYRGTASL